MNRKIKMVGAVIVITIILSVSCRTDAQQVDTAGKPVYLTFVERLISKRAEVPRGVYGIWSLVFSSPDGQCELLIIVREGPDNLAKIEVQIVSDVEFERQSSVEYLVASFHELNGVTVAVLEPAVSLSSTGLLTGLHNPTYLLCQVKPSDHGTLDVSLPMIPWRDGSPSAGTFLRTLSNSHKLLVGMPLAVSTLLNESMSAEWFGDPVVSLKRK